MIGSIINGVLTSSDARSVFSEGVNQLLDTLAPGAENLPACHRFNSVFDPLKQDLSQFDLLAACQSVPREYVPILIARYLVRSMPNHKLLHDTKLLSRFAKIYSGMMRSQTPKLYWPSQEGNCGAMEYQEGKIFYRVSGRYTTHSSGDFLYLFVCASKDTGLSLQDFEQLDLDQPLLDPWSLINARAIVSPSGVDEYLRLQLGKWIEANVLNQGTES